jgi:hypothetical protein
METVDDEIRDLALNFMEKAKNDGKRWRQVRWFISAHFAMVK